MLLFLGISPFDCIQAILGGSITNWLRFSHVLSIWAPLMLCSCGLLFSFRANLWNIGIEGQVIFGAIGATFALKHLGFIPSPALLVSVALLLGALAGAAWGALAGVLRNYGGVNEIFGGLGLNFVAQGFILWLIFGPWKREGVASMSGTDLFAKSLWLSTPSGWRVAPAALVLTVCVFALTCILLGITRYGLRLKAVGRNDQAARLYGIRSNQLRLGALAVAGSLAGLAGSLQVTGVYHRLIPSISSGYGYLALLVVMLAGYKAPAVPLITIFFAILASGSIQLPIVLQIDSSLAGVIQGGCVLAGLLVFGLKQKKAQS